MYALFPGVNRGENFLNTIFSLSQYVNNIGLWSMAVIWQQIPKHIAQSNEPFKVIIAAGLTSSHPEQSS